ncbi:hypothetical protein FACS1894120_3250 [Clostridia bacterium]|nr:hypothetical protein FACS1894120_3250 [Clostridia bacterium]
MAAKQKNRSGSRSGAQKARRSNPSQRKYGEYKAADSASLAESSGYEDFVRNHTKSGRTPAHAAHESSAAGSTAAAKKTQGVFSPGLIVLVIFFMLYYLCFAIYLLKQGGDVRKRQEELSLTSSYADELRMTNSEYLEYLKDENLPAYKEQRAREELHYAAPGERVYYVTPEE